MSSTLLFLTKVSLAVGVMLFCIPCLVSSSLAKPEPAKLTPQTPQQEQAFRFLLQGTTLLKSKKPFQARKPLEQAVTLWQQSAPAHYNLGFCYHECALYTEAIKEFQKALEIDPKLSDCIINIASCYQVEGRTKEAIAWFQNYLKKNPPDAEQVRGMIRALQKQGSEQISSDPNYSDYFASICESGRPNRWAVNSLPLRVYISRGCDEEGKIAQGFREDYNYILLSAFDDWVKATKNHLVYALVTNPEEANIVCTWTDNPDFLQAKSNKVEQGIARIKSRKTPGGEIEIVDAYITILINSQDTKLPLNDDEMKKACLHEVGHALGLAGHSTNNKDVMFFSESPSVWPALTKRDKATILHLYQDYPEQMPPQQMDSESANTQFH